MLEERHRPQNVIDGEIETVGRPDCGEVTGEVSSSSWSEKRLTIVAKDLKLVC